MSAGGHRISAYKRRPHRPSNQKPKLFAHSAGSASGSGALASPPRFPGTFDRYADIYGIRALDSCRARQNVCSISVPTASLRITRALGAGSNRERATMDVRRRSATSSPAHRPATGLTARTYPVGGTGSRCGSDQRADMALSVRAAGPRFLLAPGATPARPCQAERARTRGMEGGALVQRVRKNTIYARQTGDFGGWEGSSCPVIEHWPA
jgi:hypothetical protein